MKTRPNPVSPIPLVVLLAVIVAAGAGAEDEPWIITTPVVITEPVELGHVIVLDGGSLTVRDLAEPGLEMRGHIWATGDSSVVLEDSVIQFKNVFHGQYALVAADDARIQVKSCDYRVPNGVQHALFSTGRAEMVVEDTDFGDVQLISAQQASLEARRLTGNFEVIVQDESDMVLEDIPRLPDRGRIWVWVEFPPGSEADYSPPMPGYIESWSFPPAGATGISQTATVERCDTLLWPMLVRENSRVTLMDVPEESWVVVGFHLPNDATIEGLVNDLFHADRTLDLDDREFRLIRASVDTWNLYPQGDARVTVRDSLLGEILGFESSRVRMERTTIDGTGGFFGTRDSSRVLATNCVFTCTIEASQESTIELRASSVEPYPADPSGGWTRFGAYDDGRVFIDQTVVSTTPALSGRGLIAVSSVHNPPEFPPGSGGVALVGSIAQFSLDPAVASGSWRLEASGRGGAPPTVIGEGEDNVEDDVLGIWSGADPTIDHRLQTVLTDGLGRTLVGNIVVPGAGVRVR